MGMPSFILHIPGVKNKKLSVMRNVKMIPKPAYRFDGRCFCRCKFKYTYPQKNGSGAELSNVVPYFIYFVT